MGALGGSWSAARCVHSNLLMLVVCMCFVLMLFLKPIQSGLALLDFEAHPLLSGPLRLAVLFWLVHVEQRVYLQPVVGQLLRQQPLVEHF